MKAYDIVNLHEFKVQSLHQLLNYFYFVFDCDFCGKNKDIDNNQNAELELTYYT